MKHFHSSECINSVCLSPTVNPVFWQTGVNVSAERTHQSEVQTSVAAARSLSEPGFKNMHTETHWEEKVTVPEYQREKKPWQWWYHWFATIPAFHPLTNEIYYISLINNCICDIVRIRLYVVLYVWHTQKSTITYFLFCFTLTQPSNRLFPDESLKVIFIRDILYVAKRSHILASRHLLGSVIKQNHKKLIKTLIHDTNTG